MQCGAARAISCSNTGDKCQLRQRSRLVRILFLSPWFPYPPTNGSKLRVYNLLHGLADYHELDLITFGDEPGIDPQAPELQAICRKVLVAPSKSYKPVGLQAKLALLNPTPRSIREAYSVEMSELVQQTLNAKTYDLVIASQLGTAIYGTLLKDIPALFEEVEVGVLYERYAQARSAWHRFRHGLTWAKHRRFLANLLQGFRGCTVVSEQERSLVSKLVLGDNAASQPIDLIPNGIDLAFYRKVVETPQPASLIFTGSLHYAANYEGMVWFLEEVFPLVRAT